MRLIERLRVETESLHGDADQDANALTSTATTADDYRRFLARCYGFVAPVERALLATQGLDELVDLRRFHKQELLRRDLMSLRMTAARIDELPQCTVPLFDGPDEALGWAYVIERSTLAYATVFRSLAANIPGEMAFSSSYLKCYFGTVGEMWWAFGQALDRFALDSPQAQRVIDAARIAFRTQRTWRAHLDNRPLPSTEEQQSA